VPTRPKPRRLHVRAIVRDGRNAFIRSQSLRKLELDDGREMLATFESDWALTDVGTAAVEDAGSPG
jgi:hypothetical protein